MTRIHRFDAGEIARDLARDTPGFCAEFFPEGRRVGNYWQMGDTSGTPGRSLSIRLFDHGGRPAGKWTDHATGEFGDLLDLLRENLSYASYSDVLKTASDFVGALNTDATFAEASPMPPRQSGDRIAAARRLFSYGRSIQGSLAEQYLRSRCIERFGSSLAFHPNTFLRGDDGERIEHPALLARIQNNAAETTGCVRIFLNPSGSGLADISAPKRVLGNLYHHGVRFGPWQSARDLIVGEGLENTLSLGTALPHAALTACITANHMAGFVAPTHHERIWIAHDNDEAGRRAASQLEDHVRATGKKAYSIPSLREDTNADLVTDGVETLRNHLVSVIAEQAHDHDLWPHVKVA